MTKKMTFRILKWFFFGLLVLLMVFQVFYLIGPAFNDSINTYNARLSDIEEKIVRGDILDRNGMVIATTKIDEDEMYRYYPYDEVFAHVVGYSHQGRTGIEALADLYLLQSHNNFQQKLFQELSFDRAVGDNVTTTLDGELQIRAYELLDGRDGAVIAIDPSTGEILAMVSNPGFNPNDLEDQWNTLITDTERSPLLNRGTQGLYPPGSTYKIITTAAYLQNHGAEDFFYFCMGSDYFGNKEIHCYHENAHGRENLEEAFYHSCNTAFAYIGQSLDIDSLIALNHTLLFNQSLPYPLPHSKSQFVMSADPTDAMLAETVIGQGETLMTPLHTLLITAAIANEGVLVKPYLLEAVEDQDGQIVEQLHYVVDTTDMTDEAIAELPQTSWNLFDSETADTIAGYMRSVVESGTGYRAALENYEVCGKTGTAQNNSELDHAWFVGFAPYNNPEIAIVVLVEQGGSGGSVAAPIAGELIELYLNE